MILNKKGLIMLTENSCFEAFQAQNRLIYGCSNDQNYSNTDLFSWMHRHITHVLKAVRKKNYKDIKYHLCMALSWALSLANRYHFELADEMWKRFPGYCPYCFLAPCGCGRERRNKRRRLGKRCNGKRPMSLAEWQKMFGSIYPNPIIDQAAHLAEEAGEVDEAIRNFAATHNSDWLMKTIEELVDVVTNIFGIANCRRLYLSEHMAKYFSAGCPRCHREVCNCGFVADDQPI